MGNGSRAFLAGGLGFAAAFVVACGGQNGLLSGSEAGNLSAQLNSISSAVASGQCGAAASSAQSFGNSIAALPPSVNKTLVQNLGQGAATVSQLAAHDCQSSSSTSSSSTSTSSTTTTPTTSTSTSSTSTSSSSPSSTSTATNSTGSGTNTTSNGGAGIGGTNGNGGTGAGGN